MSNVKKSISIVLVSLMLLISCFLLMACGKSVTSADAYTLIDETLNTYKDSEIFEEGEIYGLETNFVLQDFKSKNSDGTLVSDSENYVALAALGLNFIEENYAKLDGMQVKYDYNKINKAVNEMNSAFKRTMKEYNNFNNLESSANYEIYNGKFARYKEASRTLIIKVYSAAQTLGNFLINEGGVSKSVGAEDMTTEALNYYYSYNELLISRDFMNFFLKSCRGQSFEEELFVNTETLFKGYTSTIFAGENKSLTSDEAQDLKEVFTAVSGDRENVTTSLNNFSLRLLFTKYEGSIDAYEIDNGDANIYYNSINSYFNNNGILQKLFAYLQ